MKVLLVYTNRNRQNAPPPVGLAFIANAMKKAGHEVHLTDLMFSTDPLADLAAAVRDFRPGVAGFSIRNLDEQDMSRESTTLQQIRPFVQALKQAGVATVLGGMAFSTFPRQMLEYMGADYGIAGQGEEGFPQLVRSLEEGSPDLTIPGLVWRMDGQIRANPPSLPGYRNARADWSVIDHAAYRRCRWMPTSVIVKTGCNYRCSYCDAPTVFGDHFVMRQVDAITDDIRCLRHEHGMRVMFLADPCFNSPPDFAKEVLEAIIRADLGVYLITTVIPVAGHCDAEFFELFLRAGGQLAVFGVEGLSATMLESYAKPFAMQDVVRSCVLAREKGVRVGVTAMFGGPGETESTLGEAEETLERLPFAMLMSCLGIRIVPGAPLFQVARREGVVQSPEELMFPRFYLSPALDEEKARARIRAMTRRYSHRFVRMIPFGIRWTLAQRLGLVF